MDLDVPTITAFEHSPDRGQGLARDMRVRWALEEVGQPYEVRLVSFAAMKEPAHRALHPFGQIPTYEEGDLALFESGAIVLHIAEHHAGPVAGRRRMRGRARSAGCLPRSTRWNRRSSNSPPRGSSRATSRGPPQRLPLVLDRMRERLDDLSARLGDADWLDGDVQRRRPDDGRRAAPAAAVGPAGASSPSLAAYVARGEARPAFKRAFAAQLAVFQSQAANG